MGTSFHAETSSRRDSGITLYGHALNNDELFVCATTVSYKDRRSHSPRKKTVAINCPRLRPLRSASPLSIRTTGTAVARSERRSRGQSVC